MNRPGRWVTWWLLLLLAAPAGRALAEEPPEPASSLPAAPPVEELVREALVRSPTVAALQARVDAARSMVRPAGALPDPMLEVMYQNVGAPWDPMRQMTMGQVQYSQPLPWPGKLGSRRDAASAEAEMRVAETEDARRTLVMQVRTAYARIYMLDRELDSVVSAREMLRLVTAIALTRYSSGQGEQEAILKSQLEASRLEERNTDIVAQRAAWVSAINRLLDRPAGEGLGPVLALPAAEVSTEQVIALALERSPEVAMRTAALQAARRRLDAARLESRPNFLVGLGAGSTLVPDAVITLRFGIELPIWKSRKTLPMLAQARAELAAANEDLRAAQARVRTDAERLMAQWRRDSEQVVRYREAILPLSAVAMEAARGSYLAGRGDFSMVIEDFRMWLEARVLAASREADRFMTWSEIQMLVSSAPGPTEAGGER